MKKWLLGILLTLGMSVALNPTFVLAETVYYVSATGSDFNDGLKTDTPFQTLKHAVDIATSDSTTIKILSDLTSSTISIGSDSCRERKDCYPDNINKRINLDLNGYTIESNAYSNAVIVVWGDAELTVDDSSSSKNGEIKTTATAKTHVIENLGKLDLKAGTLTMSCTTNSWPGGGVCCDNSAEFNMYDGKIEGCSANTGGGVCVGFSNGGGTFNMYGGTISNCLATKGAGVYVCNASTFTMNDGTITDCSASGDAGGVYITGGTFNMTGGIIKDCVSTGAAGAGVYSNSSTFNMTYATISNCSAYTTGGGVCVYGGTTTVSSGSEISGCQSMGANVDWGGGGVSAFTGNFVLDGGKITNNTAQNNYGGGVWYREGTVTIGGDSQVTGNKAGSVTDNVYLPSGKTITVGTGDAVPTSDMSVGVKMANPGVFTSNPADGYKGCFSADNEGYGICCDTDKKLKMAPSKSITYKDKGGDDFSGEHESGYPKKYVVGEETALKGADKDGYTFEGWYKESDCSGNEIESIAATETEDITLYAKWKKDEKPSKNIIYKDKDGDEFSGTHESGYPKKYVVGEETALKGASKDGYTFEGWYKESDCSGDEIESIAATETEDITLYAKWKSNKKEEPKKKEPKEEPKKEDTYESSLPSKSLVSNTVVDPNQTYDIKAHEMSDRDIYNQSFLVFYNAAMQGKDAMIIANYGIYPNRNLSITENGSMQILTWSNLDYKTPGRVYALCYNQIDGVYVISGTIDEYGTARLTNYKLRPATNITLYVEY